MPAGDGQYSTVTTQPGAAGTTRTISMRPLWRLSTAMPPLAPLKETNTQQPSPLGFTAKGLEGSAMVTDGEASGALQPLGWAWAWTPVANPAPISNASPIHFPACRRNIGAPSIRN